MDSRSPVQHTLVLHRVDPDRHVAQFYSLMIERDLFGAITLVRSWGRIGTGGRERVEALARELLRETIERSGWYPRDGRVDCDRLIERDVELIWPLMAQAAREWLRAAPGEYSGSHGNFR